VSEPTTPAPTLAVQVEGLRKSYDGGTVIALDGLDLTVHQGEIVAIMGPSGSGKSTLLHLLAALDRPDSGRLSVEGTDLTHLRHPDRYRQRVVGLVFQLHNLLPHLTSLQNVEIPMMGTGRSRAEQRTRALDLLAETDLADKARRYPPKLSGGERQRVAIARALANEPRVLLADEPTGSLDSAAVGRVLELFRQLRDEHDVTIVMVTHDPEVAAAADRTVTLRDGRVAD
jgi:ABC-type lipoprotein export system ATPase subunit